MRWIKRVREWIGSRDIVWDAVRIATIVVSVAFFVLSAYILANGGALGRVEVRNPDGVSFIWLWLVFR